MKSFCVLNSVLSEAAAESLGKAATQALGQKIAVLSNDAAGINIAQGIKKAGGCALLFNNCFESQVYFAVKHFSPQAVFFSQGDEKSSVAIYDSSALPVSSALEEKISLAALQSGQISGDGEVIEADLSGVYYKELLGCGESFENVNVSVVSRNSSVKAMLTRAVFALGGLNSGKVKFCISPSGLVLSAVDENGKVHTHDELISVCCRCALEAQERIDVPFTVVQSVGNSGLMKAGFQQGNELWQRDAVFLAAKLLHYMSFYGCGLCTLCQKIEPQFVSRKSFSGSLSIPDIADLLDCDELITDDENSAFLKNAKGSIYITKNSRANKFCVEARAASAETAKELAVAVEKAACLTYREN